MSPRLVHTIVAADVGHHIIRKPNGRHLYIGSAIGRVQRCDVGKRVFDVDGVIQVENNEQLARRLARSS